MMTVTRTAWRACHPDLRSSHGYRWPFPGNEAVAPLPDGAEFTRGDPCPRFEGDGLCLAKTWRGAASGGIPAITCLLVEFDDADVLGEDDNKVRVSRCRVVDVFDAPALIRDGWCRDADLRGANLRGADLWGADLWGADLRGANLWGADLRGADLRGANLCDANLCDANLRGANLRGANLRGANLSGADLSGADLLLAEGWTPPPDPHEDIARELYETAFPPAAYADSRSVGPMLLAAVHRIPDDLARQVADALRGDDADG